MQRRFHRSVYFQHHFGLLFTAKIGEPHQQYDDNAIKKSEIPFSSFQLILPDLSDVSDGENLRENLSKNKKFCKNAVTWEIKKQY